MPVSPYCLIFANPTANDMVLFSTASGALITMSEADHAALRQGSMAPDHVATLRELGFLVADPQEEQRRMLGYLDAVNRENPNLTIALVLGLACNFACPYCFQGGVKSDTRAMDDPTAEQLVAFIDAHFTPGKKKLVLQIYGGEPLLYTELIIFLAKRLKPLIENKGGHFVMELVSNGSLLDESVLRELKQWGLAAVKVTIDGPPHLHNQSRPLRTGKESFALIVDNLKKACRLTSIRLGGNYSRDTFHHFPALLDILQAEGIGPSQLELVNFNMVMQVEGSEQGPGCGMGCATVNEPWISEAALFIRREILRRGYAVAEIAPQPCAVEIADALTVNHDGSLYKCVTWAGREEYRIGDIWHGVDAKRLENHHLGHWKKEEECRTCPYLPLCFGGCRFMAEQRDGHMGKVDCMKQMYDDCLRELLLIDIAATS